MTENKTWYRSRTIWGGLVALASALVGLFGLEIDADTGTSLAVALTDAAAAIGAVVAILGRQNDDRLTGEGAWSDLRAMPIHAAFTARNR